MLRYLKEIGMCKRCEWIGKNALDICDDKFDVTLVSFGDIRQNKYVFGENPIALDFGVCMFDYVFLFITMETKNKYLK